MKNYYLEDGSLTDFISAIMGKYPVIAPVAKKSRFVFAQIENADEVRLDYDTTILPPKKVFFPTKQDLVHFDGKKYSGCIDPVEKVLLGVHPYDIKAIAMTDRLFEENNSDKNYLANRKTTIIVGSSVQKHYKNAFFGSICADVPVSGHDAFLTRVKDGYVFETLTGKGDALAELVRMAEASDSQIKDASLVNKKALESCPECLDYDSGDVKDKVRGSFRSEIWTKLSENCFSCGSCNIVCPTCYCFDVQDEWGLGSADGKRYRRWDACLTAEFATVSTHAGTENFREDKTERYRHRFMRKTAYLNDKLGNPACVGCGRCSGACTADIANPVKTISEIMES